MIKKLVKGEKCKKYVQEPQMNVIKSISKISIFPLLSVVEEKIAVSYDHKNFLFGDVGSVSSNETVSSYDFYSLL